MQHDDGKTHKMRPRSKTGASPPHLLKARKAEPWTATPSSPPSNDEPTLYLPLEDIIKAFTPPAVLSLAHARALVVLLRTEKPKLELLTPVFSRLCAPGVPSALLATGIEALSAYAGSRTQPLSDIERASLFSLLRSSGPNWTADTSMPRLKCLQQLTSDGTDVTGCETAFLTYTRACISSAFESLLSDDDSDRGPREKFLESMARIMRETFVKNGAFYTEDDMLDLLGLFENFVRRTLDGVPAGLPWDSTSIPSSPGASPSISHRRNASSTGGPVFYPGNRLPNTRDAVSPLDRTLLPISLYMSALDMYRAQLTPANIPRVISLLLRIISVHLSPLPRLGAWLPQHHQPRPAEDSSFSQLFFLLSGPYASTVAAHIKGFLSSTHPQEALGAFRSIRVVSRDAAESRMALVALRRPRYDIDEYAPSGLPVTSEAHAKVLQRAHREGLEVPGLAVNRLVGAVGKAVRVWAARADAEKVLEEALGLVKDLLAEANDRVDRDDGEDYSMINIDEGRFVGTILSEAVKYVQRMRLGKTSILPIDRASKIPFLPIDKPAAAPTPLLLTLCAQLALPLSTPMTPSLPSILLSITSHLTDAQTATIPQTMHTLGQLTPTSLSWLNNISDLFMELVNRERPMSTHEVYSVTETVHADLMGVPTYRRKLGRRVCELAERALASEENGAVPSLQGDEAWARLCANELVWRILEAVHGGEQDGDEDDDGEDDIVERIIAVLVRHVLGGCPCMNMEADDSLSVATTPVPATPGVSVSSSNASTPALSRAASEFPVPDKDPPPPQPSTSVLPPLMFMLPGWSLPRAREPSAPASPMTLRSSVSTSTTTSRVAKDTCRPVCAALALISAFQDLSFAKPPQPAHAVRLYKALLAVLKKAKCPRARMAVLQLLMRLRADRDHRVYIMEDLDDDIEGLATLVDRSRSTARDSPPGEGAEVRRARSVSRGLRRGRARSSAESRSRSRPSPMPAPARAKPRELLWSVPELLPFNVPVSEPVNGGVTTYEANAPTEWEELKHWLPVSDYVFALVEILRYETDWDILSYVLCHLPVQLANKHFFCGPKSKGGIVALLVTLCTVTLKGEAANSIVDQMPESLRLRDAQGLVFHALGVLVSYRGIFDERKHHDMLVETFLAGLNSQSSTVKFCLNALSICAYELPSSITKNLVHIMEQLARIMSNAETAVHILDFVSIVGSLPSLYANFREQDFRVVFGVALTYIHYHNSPDTQGLSGRESFALSQHVLVVAYYIIYVWFLAVALPDRPKHVQFLTRKLLLANEAKGAVDEPTEVCFDWLARYTYATADPKPAYSLLRDIVMNPPHNAKDEPAGNSAKSKTWLWGNSLVTIRTLPKRGWVEVESVRPSGETKYICKLENFPQVNPGDVDPDVLSDPAIMMSDRDPTQMARKVPDPDNDQSQSAVTERAARGVRDIFVPSVEQQDQRRPDPVTGYVWSQSAPSQRRKDVSVDPSFFALQLSQYPHLPKPDARSWLVPPSTQLDALLRTLKHTPVIDMHKIAILYVAPGQKEEREILGNRHGSPAYTRFLEGIGRLIRVRDQQDVYTGDIIPETDGEYTYAWWDDIVQVVYHTATLMPNLSMDPVFMYKKRHVGNDKVRIVWNDSGLPYRHHTISSAFNFVNIIIEPHSLGTIAAYSNNKHEHEFFKVTMQRMEGMPAFGPIGDYQLVSAENLPQLLRQVSLLADFFSEVYEATNKDTSMHEYITNWRRRLQYINTFRRRMESKPLPEPAEETRGDRGLRDIRDFTRFF